MSYEQASLLYLLASVLFILALKGLSHPETSRRGNMLGMLGMALAIATTLAMPGVQSYWLIGAGLLIGGSIGTVIALKIKMTALPQLVAAFHSLVGLAATFVAIAAYYNPAAYGIGVRGAVQGSSLIEMSLGLAIGAITFTGSIVAFGKLQGLISGKPVTFPMQHLLNLLLGLAAVALGVWLVMDNSDIAFWLLLLLSLALGFLIIIPIGGADMPVVISMLNSYSGWAAAGIGFTLEYTLLIVTGALVGTTGAILSYIMCKGMNRSFFSVILGGFGGEAQAGGGGGDQGDKTYKQGAADDAAFLMANSSKVIIVPGYGMAVAQAQQPHRGVADQLKKRGGEGAHAIPPGAGRMPGHMNVLLAEANVPYDEVFEMEEINREFAAAEVAYVIGANDVTNPSAKTDPKSPIFGMPILDVEKAQNVLFVKRSMASGYAGVDNPLFYMDRTMMLLADAKKMTEDIVKALEKL